MSTMVERSVIPERIMEQAIDTLDLLRGSFGDFDRDDNAAIIAETLLAAEKRGKEEAAKIAANLSPDDVTDDSHTNGWTLGFLRARKCIAAAIRES